MKTRGSPLQLLVSFCADQKRRKVEKRPSHSILGDASLSYLLSMFRFIWCRSTLLAYGDGYAIGPQYPSVSLNSFLSTFSSVYSPSQDKGYQFVIATKSENRILIFRSITIKIQNANSEKQSTLHREDYLRTTIFKLVGAEHVLWIAKLRTTLIHRKKISTQIWTVLYVPVTLL